jgi:hypothetical protein
MLRDPRYTVPLGILLGVILVSAVLMNRQTSAASPAVPSTTPSAVDAAAATPVPADQSLDWSRAADLAKLRGAVELYHTRRGAYPSTGNAVVQICADPVKPSCAVAAVVRQDPAAAESLPYWYVSDGSTYATFVSPADVAGDPKDCPPRLPSPLASKPVMCVRIQAGGG